jgi:predicted NAD-dependent protein-ADP-ribosyltransferase YbiA (DUF1768 family)/SAM-dependent methyltransferase
MELFSDEVSKIKSLLNEWKTHPEVEVESTFGTKGQVDMQTFLRVVTRLKSKGYQAISQEDRLTIKLPNDVRFTLSGSGHVSQYCRDNSIVNKPYVAIIKDNNISEENQKAATIDLKGYDVRIKGRREIELGKDNPRVTSIIQPDVWGRQKKYFRLIRRWTFKIPGLKFDLSMTRSTMPNRDGKAWQLNFQDQNLISFTPVYEIEVELDRSTIGEKDEFKTIVNGIGEILRGIQGSPILITNEKKVSVLEKYSGLTGTERFRGAALMPLLYKNFTAYPEEDVPNIRKNYNVTDKADGLRVMGFTDESGELFMIDMALNVYRTGLSKPTCKNSLVDGEYITEDKAGRFIQSLLLFDIYYMNGVDVTKKPFKADNECRYTDLSNWMDMWRGDGGPQRLLKTAGLTVGMKTYLFTTPVKTIFQQADTILAMDDLRAYNTDGLIFTPDSMPLPQRPGETFFEQFKWKPSKDNTVDFLVLFEKDEEETTKEKVAVTIHPDTQEYIRYKTLRLFVGSSEDPAYNDPRATILFDLPLPGGYVGDKEYKPKYKPVPFTPGEYYDQYASVCYMQTQVDPKTQEEFVITERTEQPIRDLSIVEMRYDPTKPVGWRWIPIRVRSDKTERLLKGTRILQTMDDRQKFSRLKLERTLNSYVTAMGVWNSINEPVTPHMIRTGEEAPSEAEKVAMKLTGKKQGTEKKYYERQSSQVDRVRVKELTEFHNKYIKDKILYPAIGKNSPEGKLLDVAVGRANDLHRWRRTGLSFVLGVDATGACCVDKKDGGYRRLLDTKVMANRWKDNNLPIPPMFFCIADSSRRLIDGSAGINDEERDMLRSILGRIEPIGAVPPAVQRSGAGALTDGADAMSCMYAIHYFFETSEKFNGLLQNIADNLKIGGYFIGTNFDGDAVFNFMRGIEPGKGRIGLDGNNILWELTKHYEGEELPTDDSAFGMAIDVNFVTIGITHREYLVPWKLLVSKLKTIGCELLDAEELAKIGLNSSSNMYEVSFDMAMKERDRKRFQMNEIAKEYSFLNRWYIFKRTSSGSGTLGKVVEGTLEKVEEEPTLAELSAVIKTHASAPVEVQEFAQKLATAQATKNLEELMALDEQSLELQKVAGIQVPMTQGTRPGELAEATIASLTAAPAAAPSVAVPSTAAAPVAQAQTVPVKPATAIILKEKYDAKDVFKFHENSIKTDRYLQLPDAYKSYAARHMAPNAPFRVVDPADGAELDDTKIYPSITHFLAAMKFKYASGRPELATIFSRKGEIHQQWVAARLAQQKAMGNKVLSKDQQNELLLKETDAVLTEATKYLNTKSVRFEESKWATVKDKLLREAVSQRIRSDKWFCVITDAAIQQGKYMLYNNEKDMELGGTYGANKKIQGLNKYGLIVMELANKMGDEFRACIALPDIA